jgi:hypothetical protein
LQGLEYSPAREMLPSKHQWIWDCKSLRMTVVPGTPDRHLVLRLAAGDLGRAELWAEGGMGKLIRLRVSNQ